MIPLLTGIPLLNFLWWLLTGIGLARIFHKYRVKALPAFIPFYRIYRMGKICGADRDGRLAAAAEVGALGFTYLYQHFKSPTEDDFRFLYIIAIVAALSYAIHMVRIELSLCRAFGKSKLWVIAWIFLDAPTALYWGFSSRFYPVFGPGVPKAPAPVFNLTQPVLEKGLTVNIKRRGVWDFFRYRVLLRDIHLGIQPGHMVLLLGGSGAGKTTFVNAITGYEKANARILLNGEDIYRRYKDMKYDIGLVPQEDLMRKDDTVLSTLLDSAKLRLPTSVTEKERNRMAEDTLKSFGLYSIRHSQVEKLSGGQKKRLSIAMEYIANPSLFILDEPDSGLDGVIAVNLMKRLRGIADEGKIVIVITHTPDRVIDFFDDVIVLAKDANETGRLAFFGPVREARTFFGKDTMENILLSINQTSEGGEGRADEFIQKYGEQKKAEREGRVKTAVPASAEPGKEAAHV